MINGFALFTIFIILAWCFVYTLSYGIWTWKDKNRFGSLMIILLAAAIIILPIYTLFFKGS
ncbi:hypothetical protein CDQ83_06080 [Clostridium thermosuccinogenes]|nr:hypothetical protein CDQ83_06080 [Pseudoclostridium thermosuccinogenes]